MKLTKGYLLIVDKEDWMKVSKALNLYHRLISGPMRVNSYEDYVSVRFAYRIWNESKVDMMLILLKDICDIDMRIQED